ncbi:MAG TPA: hypothetical protein VGI63_08500 [Verrucomicrobiae bacterium]
MATGKAACCAEGLPRRRIRIILGNAGDFQWQHTQEQAISYIGKNLFDYFAKKIPALA